MRIRRFVSIIFRFALCSLIGGIFLTETGCEMNTMRTSPSSNTPTALTARVMGGRKAVSDSSVVLYEAGTSGMGSGATQLAATTSDSVGNFTFDSFSCIYPNSQLYVTASDGDAGNGPNSNILLIAMLGPCNNLPGFVVVNELSTVAAAYAFAQFMDPQNPVDIGTDGIPGTTEYIGMTNAGAMLINNLVNVPGGVPATVIDTSPNSPATLNTLADILVYCVNSPSPYTNCDNLYSTVVPPSGGSAPANTLQAALDIALSPGQNPTIYSLLSQVPVALPYTPTLTAAPNDWLLALKFIPGDISVPRGMAIDQAGDIWVANAGTSSITELSPLGVEISPFGGYKPAGLDAPEELFFDALGNIWITNYSGNTVEAINSFGAVVVPAFGNTSYNHPTGIVTDSFNQVWTTNSGAQNLTVSTTAGDVSFSVNLFGIYFPNRITADTTVSPNIMWVANSSTGGVSRIVNDGTSFLSGTSVSGGGQDAQQGITIDHNGDVWVSNTSGSVTKILNTSPPTISLGSIAVGGINSSSSPWGITADTANNVWVNNFDTSTVTELDSNGNALSPAGGFTAGGLIAFPRNGIAVDRSGNVWVLDDDFAPFQALTVLLGAAAPVATPRTTGRPIAPGAEITTNNTFRLRWRPPRHPRRGPEPVEDGQPSTEPAAP